MAGFYGTMAAMLSGKIKRTILILIAAAVLVLAVRFICEKSENKITYINASADLIKVELPFPGAVTGKEFSAIGEARGYWFFEASFPIEVIDKDGNSLAIGIAQAQPDPQTGEINWMTENFVPFKADIKVPESYIGPATLILKKDNPSGLPQNDASVSFPITIEY